MEASTSAEPFPACGGRGGPFYSIFANRYRRTEICFRLIEPAEEVNLAE